MVIVGVVAAAIGCIGVGLFVFRLARSKPQKQLTIRPFDRLLLIGGGIIALVGVALVQIFVHK